MNELALFAGAGGGILGGHLLGWRTVCAVEWDAYAASVLVARQNDGCLPPFPVWDDVQTFDGRPWRGVVDVVSGGFPCQDISAAGKGAGIDGQRSSMWSHMARIIGEVRPRYAFVENSPMLVGRGLARVLGELAALGYDARWGVLGADQVGAPHKRERIWIVAYAASGNGAGYELHHGNELETLLRRSSGAFVASSAGQADVAEANSQRSSAGISGPEQWKEGQPEIVDEYHSRRAKGASWWDAEPDVGRVANGVAARVDRLRCLGNGQVPAVVALAWETLTAMSERGGE